MEDGRWKMEGGRWKMYSTSNACLPDVDIEKSRDQDIKKSRVRGGQKRKMDIGEK